MNFESKYLPEPIQSYLNTITEPEPEVMALIKKHSDRETEVAHMSCGPQVGGLLKLFVRLMQPKLVVEIGTFVGYSAHYMASALSEGARLITLEVDPRHAKTAKTYFDQMPYGEKIDLRLGRGLDSLASIDEPIDLVFLDADKKRYPKYYEMLVPKMRSGGLIVIDNTLWSGRVLESKERDSQAIDEVNRMASNDPRVETLMLAIRDGITLCTKY